MIFINKEVQKSESLFYLFAAILNPFLTNKSSIVPYIFFAFLIY